MLVLVLVLVVNLEVSIITISRQGGTAIDQPALAISLKTAKAIGLISPPAPDPRRRGDRMRTAMAPS